MTARKSTEGIPINFVQLISKKRDHCELSEKEIRDLVAGYTEGSIPDYQMAAFSMAVLLNGMTIDETVALTKAMFESGDVLNWNDDPLVVDKHSTGGIGDKVSIVLAPMLCCCGVKVPMISGRGLGPTGGTLDKLESIPGFRTDLSSEEIRQQVDQVGCVITGASPQIAPADRKLYALRDVTGTVESISLITASILSKKLAAGLEALVLDVKVGSGAFMKTMDHAIELANSLVLVGNQLGMKTTALVTDMNQVLGASTGNAIEIAESISLLQGEGPADLEAISIELGAYLLDMVNGEGLEGNRKNLLATIGDGSALSKFQAMVDAQGGHGFNHEISETFSIDAGSSGYLEKIDASKIGFAIIELGGGRKKMGDKLDLGVGIQQLSRVGDEISAGDPVFRVVSSKPAELQKSREAIRLLQDSFTISDRRPEVPELIHKVISP